MTIDDPVLASSDPGLRTALLDQGAIEALSELVGGDLETLAEITDAFLEEAPERLVELREGLEQDEADLAGRAAHTLKSNALTFGALVLAATCRDLEEAARSGALQGASDLVDRAEAEWALVAPELIALRDRASA